MMIDRVAVTSWVLWPWAATLLFWTCFGACIDAPSPDTPPQARVIAQWDPLACGDPHRVVLELEDEGGAPIRASTPCNLGALTLDVPHFGFWRGRFYAWTLDIGEHSIAHVDMTIDEPVLRWFVPTPK